MFQCMCVPRTEIVGLPYLNQAMNNGTLSRRSCLQRFALFRASRSWQCLAVTLRHTVYFSDETHPVVAIAFTEL